MMTLRREEFEILTRWVRIFLNVLRSVCLELEKITGIDITTVNFSRNM